VFLTLVIQTALNVAAGAADDEPPCEELPGGVELCDGTLCEETADMSVEDDGAIPDSDDACEECPPEAGLPRLLVSVRANAPDAMVAATHKTHVTIHITDLFLISASLFPHEEPSPAAGL
jgi:hypothetical protein